MNTTYRNPLHLYRALLREAGYLFDSASQDFHTQHIRCSFRRQKDRRDVTQHGKSSLPSQEVSHQLKRGRKYLYMLQRANEGYSGAVKNVLKTTYALKGKRRRNMMKELMVPQSVESAEYSKDWQPPPKFTMIMNCQSKVHRFLEAGKLIPPPVIPDKNKQQKQFPKVRIKGIMKRWYARQAEILFPPLSEAEHLQIYQKATRILPSTKPRPRRPAGTREIFATLTNDEQGSTLGIATLATSSAQALEHQYSHRLRAIIGHPHNLTPRYVRRRFKMMVLQRSPTALHNPKTDRLAYRWDHGIKHRQPQAVFSPSQQLMLFDL